MPYKNRDVQRLNRRLVRLRKAIRDGRSYSPWTPEIREARARRKLYWRVVRAIYYRLKQLGWKSPAKRAKQERQNAYKRRMTDLRGRKRRVGLTPEQRAAARREGKINRRLREKRTRVSGGIIEKLKGLQKHRCAALGGLRGSRDHD